MHDYGGLSGAVSAVLLLLFSLYIGLHQAVFAALLAWAARSRAGYSRRALFLAPFLWVTVELLRTYLVGFPWDLLGTTRGCQPRAFANRHPDRSLWTVL